MFDRTPQFGVTITDDQSEADLDTAALKPPAGDYIIAFYGGAVVKYRHRFDAVAVAETALKKVEQEVITLAQEAQRLTEESKTVSAESKAEVERALEAIVAKQKSAASLVTTANEQFKAATQRSQPRDIVDIVVSEPITIRVIAQEAK